jgi:DNA-binding protein HU-beta
MTKSDLITALSDRTQITKKDTELFLGSLADIGAKELKSSGEFSLPGFGKLEVVERAARVGRNPRTGESVSIPATQNLKFKITKVLKDSIN